MEIDTDLQIPIGLNFYFFSLAWFNLFMICCLSFFPRSFSSIAGYFSYFAICTFSSLSISGRFNDLRISYFFYYGFIIDPLDQIAESGFTVSYHTDSLVSNSLLKKSLLAVVPSTFGIGLSLYGCFHDYLGVSSIYD